MQPAMPIEPAMTTDAAKPSEPAPPSDIAGLCDTIEDCYEFTLSYAAKGLATEAGNDLGRQLREKLTKAATAMRGLESACASAAREFERVSREAYDAFSAVLARDAESSIAALELVLAQPVISSQLIDNLNASIHVRALLTDLFLITEILSLRQTQAKSAAAE
jgi:hypothetical protein